MRDLTRLAFVDVETTGLSPVDNRIAEIGIITVDGARVERWTTLIRSRARRQHSGSDESSLPDTSDAPCFGDIANELAQRISGRLLVAHNARFDHAFLRAEFDRAGIAFHADVVCSVMLSRKLYPHFDHHDLDSLVGSLGLHAQERHRALPDADLVWQLWQAIHRQHSPATIGSVVEGLLAGPILPSELDASLIGRLPEAPGAYVFHDRDGQPLAVGAAGNLRLHVANYFRLDQATGKALEYAHRISNITWRATGGMLGAQLQAAALERELPACSRPKSSRAAFTWRLSPEAVPCIDVVPISYASGGQTDAFGLFPTERKARNALARFAARHRLCHCLLGISKEAKEVCLACPVDACAPSCAGRAARKKALIDLFVALRPMRVPSWPHRGAVGIRERSDLHVVDQWQFLGTARSEGEVHELLETRRHDFDRRTYGLLNRALARLPQRKIVDLAGCAPDRDAGLVAADLRD